MFKFSLKMHLFECKRAALHNVGVGTILLPAALTKCSLLDRGRLRVAAQGTLQIPWCGGAGEKLCLTFSCA